MELFSSDAPVTMNPLESLWNFRRVRLKRVMCQSIGLLSSLIYLFIVLNLSVKRQTAFFHLLTLYDCEVWGVFAVLNAFKNYILQFKKKKKKKKKKKLLGLCEWRAPY